MKIDYPATLARLGVLLLVVTMVPMPYSIILSLFLTWVYQYVIALIFGVHAMPTLDMVCFLGMDTARANIHSFTIIDKYEFEKAKKRVAGFMRDKAKLRQKIKKIWGDYYWQDTTVEESLDYCF